MAARSSAQHSIGGNGVAELGMASALVPDMYPVLRLILLIEVQHAWWQNKSPDQNVFVRYVKR